MKSITLRIMQALYTTAQIRTIEQHHGAAGMMEQAGQAAAKLALHVAATAGPLLVVAGPGNNGGDALVAARCLRQQGCTVDVVCSAEPEHLPPAARSALQDWLACGGRLQTDIPAGRPYRLALDGLFGIGLTRPPAGSHATLISRLNALDIPVLAIDLPSGLCADTGRALGETVRAQHTLTLLGLKPGLFTLDGPDHAGILHCDDLNASAFAPTPAGHLIDSPPSLPVPRRRNCHKGHFGNIGVLGGEVSMTGAILLAGRAALLAGAGRVCCGFVAPHPPVVDPLQPELMLYPARQLPLADMTVLTIGPGMGKSPRTTALLRQAISQPQPLLLDADALHLLASSTDLRRRLAKRDGCTIVTPHPGEAAALLKSTVAAVQDDRIAAALEIARSCHAITVLKGCGSVIATADGRWFINASGNPGMASAGMGDVLSGLIGGLLAQGMEPEDATLTGVHLHGAAADRLLVSQGGPFGLCASAVATEAGKLLNQWMAARETLA